MSVIYVLIPIAILLTAFGIYLFFWAVKTEQFEDLEKQGMSILFDENQDQKKNTEQPETKTIPEGESSINSDKSHKAEVNSTPL